MKIKASVIIPVYNSEKTIKKTLEALLNQNFDEGYEIIIVDDGSSDKTVEICKKIAKKSKIPIRIFENEHHGPAWQRNFGAKKARGEIIVFTDSDCIPDKNWLKEMVKPFKDGIVGVQGTYRTANIDSWVARFEGYEIEKRHEKMKKEENIDFIGTFSAAYRRDIFLKFGGFDISFPIASGEDPELSYRIHKAGYRMVLNPNAFVYHYHPDTIKKYLRQKFYRAYWRVLMYRKHPEKLSGDSYTGKDIHISLFSLGLFYFSILLSLFNTKFLLLSTLSLLIFLLGNLKTILFMGKKEKKMFVLSPFLIFLRTHIWILGVLKGFWDIIILKKYSRSF